MSLIELVKFEPDNQTHVDELSRQRVLCGWGLESVDTWREKVRKGVKGLHWIFRSTSPEASKRFPDPLPLVERCNLGNSIGPPRPDPSFQPIGHVSLDWEDQEGETDLGSRELGNVTISSFFILVSQQGSGIGGLAMDKLERLASSPAFGAIYITLNTMDGDDASTPECWEQMGVVYDPQRPVSEHWYARRGYVAFRRGVPRYPETNRRDGSKIVVNAVYMRKRIVPSSE